MRSDGDAPVSFSAADHEIAAMLLDLQQAAERLGRLCRAGLVALQARTAAPVDIPRRPGSEREVGRT